MESALTGLLLGPAPAEGTERLNRLRGERLGMYSSSSSEPSDSAALYTDGLGDATYFRDRDAVGGDGSTTGSWVGEVWADAGCGVGEDRGGVEGPAFMGCNARKQ